MAWFAFHKWRERSSVKITERTHEEATKALHAGREGRRDAAVARRCAASGGGLRRALQQRSFEQRHRLHHAEGHARRASAGDSADRDRKLEAAREQRKNPRQRAA